MKFLTLLTIRMRLLSGFMTLALIAVFIGVLGINTISTLSANTDDMFDNQLTPVKDLANANMQAIYMNRDLFEYIIEEQKAGMDKIKLSIDDHYKLYSQLYNKYKATDLTPPEKELIGKVDLAWPPYVAAADKVMKLSYADQNKEAYAEMNTAAKKSFQDLDNYLSDLVDLNTKIAEEAKKVANETAIRTRNITIAVIVAAGLISVMLGLLITASITKPLNEGMVFSQAIAAGDMTARLQTEGRDEVSQLMRTLLGMRDGLVKVVSSVREGAESVSTASAQIAQGNQDLSSRTESQASALEETAASMEELGSQVNHNADNARQASQMASRASTVAIQGGEVVGRVVETMKGINDSSRKIADIISVIDGIAFQTNILALNAAVEAARAGEQGRGFAVVASEVRSLAGRSAEAAKEIKSLINASVERVEQGTALVDEAGTTMTEVVSSIRRVTDLVGEISSASNEQSAAVAQVGEAVIQMDQGTQQNAALVEEMAAAANSLRTQATDLVATVAVFKLDAHASASRTMPQATPAPAANFQAVRKMAVPQPKMNKPATVARPAGTVALPKPAAQAKTKTAPDAGKDEWESF